MKNHRFYANNYPYSAWSTKDGIIQLIGKSLSITFNQEKFDKYADDIQSYFLFSSRDKDLVYKKAKVLSAICGLEIVEHKNSHWYYHKNASHIKIYEELHIWNKSISYKLEYVTPMIGKIRDSYLDERKMLIQECCDVSCVICGKQVEYDSFESIVLFELEKGFRSEGCCKECLIVSGKTVRNKTSDWLLIDILQKVNVQAEVCRR